MFRPIDSNYKSLNDISMMQQCSAIDIESNLKKCQVQYVDRKMDQHRFGTLDKDKRIEEQLVYQLTKRLLEDGLISFSKECGKNPYEEVIYSAKINIWAEESFRRKFNSMEFI